MKKGSLLRSLLAALVLSALAAGLCWLAYTYREELRDALARLLARALDLLDRLKAALSRSRDDDDFADL